MIRLSFSTRLFYGIFLLLALMFVFGCQGNFRKNYLQLKNPMQNDDFNTAVAILDKAKEKNIYAERDRVMYWLNRGSLLHYAKRYKESNEVLVQAEKSIQDLFTKSVTRGATSLLTSDAVTHYDGEDYEKILLYLYTALNQLMLGNSSDALVEARAADELIKKMKIYYEKEGNIGTLYTQDAFILWLIGTLYEMDNEPNDAYLAYKDALAVMKKDYAGFYGIKPPSFLAEDIVRAALKTGFHDEAEQLKQENQVSGQTFELLKENGEVILILGVGESPFKSDFFITAAMADGYVMKIAIPQFNENPNRIAFSEIIASNNQTSRSELFEPINAIALQNYKHRLKKVTALAITRATTKYLASKGAQGVAKQAGGETLGAIVGLAANVASYATEEADKRSWLTLPHQFQVAKIILPEGQHQLKVNFMGSGGYQLYSKNVTVDVKKGKKTFVSLRSF